MCDIEDRAKLSQLIKELSELLELRAQLQTKTASINNMAKVMFEYFQIYSILSIVFPTIITKIFQNNRFFFF